MAHPPPQSIGLWQRVVLMDRVIYGAFGHGNAIGSPR